MIASILASAAETAEQHFETPLPPAAYGLITLGTFVALLLLTFAFRSVGERH